MAELTVITYGGGEILKNIFNAIAMLMSHNKHGIVWPIAIIVASFGGVWAISKAFFSSNVETFLTHYIFPLMAIPALLMLPTTNVKIEDVLKDVSYKVDNVPLFLVRFAELTSTIGYKLTQGMERVMHVPNDTSYNKTGMLFGADTSLDISKYKVTNAILEQNLNRFAKQCIIYDLALGRYSIEDLRKSTDLWTFLKDNTSKVGMIHYFDPKNDKKGEYITCAGVLPKIEELFKKEKAYFSQHELLKHLPLTFQALTGIQKGNEELLGQQIMISTLSNGLPSSNFAKLRAEAQQKSTYKVMGSIASSTLVNMRVVMEAMIYASFIIIVPLALIPGGIKFIFSWLWLCVWIQLWPPFYAILNYIMQIAAKSYAATLTYGLEGNQIGLSFFTSEGLQNLHENISATAGYLSLSIPFISYTILQGAQSFVHLVGTLASPAQSAATSSATELTSGNYSMANTNLGQMSYNNTSALQHNTAPSISSGFMNEHYGSYSAIHANDGTSIINQNNSNLRSSVFSDQAISDSLQTSYQTAQTHVASTQQSYTESISKSTRAMEDLTSHLGSSASFNESISARESNSVQESCGYLKNVVENFANQHGITSSQSYDVLTATSLSGSMGFKLLGSGITAGGSLNQNFSDLVSSSEGLSAATNLTSSKDFQEHFNNVSEFAKNKAHTSLSDEGVRLASGFTESLDKAKSSQESYQNAFNEMNQASQNLSWSESNSHQIKRSLNQDFVNWSTEQIGYQNTLEMLENKSHFEQEKLMNEFLDQYVCNLRDTNPISSLEGYKDPRQGYENGKLEKINYDSELAAMKANAVSNADEHILYSGMAGSSKDTLEFQKEIQQARFKQHFNSQNKAHATLENTMCSKLEEEHGKTRVERMWKDSTAYQAAEQLLWIDKD